MQNFEFYNPTKIIFGKNNLAKIGKEASKYGKKALLVYGKSSLKTTGVFEQIAEALKENGIEFVEFGGVQPNPLVSHARAGIDLAKKEKVDLIIGAGGGSVLDEAKAIAMGAACEDDIWDIMQGQKRATAALPVLTILTVAATGSEMNNCFVLTEDETHFKAACFNNLVFPKASILDPTFTTTLPLEYTAFAAADIFSHLTEGYFTQKEDTLLQDGLVEAEVRTIIESMRILIADSKDYTARANMMWAATLGWNGLLNSGIGRYATPCHMLGHPLSGHYDLAHGASLSIVTPKWLREKAKTEPRRIANFFRRIFGTSFADDATCAEEGIQALETWYKEIGTPLTMKEAGVQTPDLNTLAASAHKLAKSWGMKDFSEEYIRAFYEKCI